MLHTAHRVGPLRIGVTLGDPCGIGPELVAHALAQPPAGVAMRVFGDATGFSPGRPDDRSARAQVAWLEAAAEAARRGEIDALVTAPISKVWARRAGFTFPGHTEFLAARLGAAEHAMMMASPRLRVVLATTHLPLAEVPRRLGRAEIERAIRLAAYALRDDFGIARPTIGVCGLNPHAGEDGWLGREEIDIVAPAIEAARAALRGVSDAQIVGPLAADSAFAPVHEPRLDAIVALYHDQGLIPVKALDFDRAVNVTLGLPIPRTSPDHGVAYALAGTGRARPASFLAALEMAIAMAERRRSRA
ncbi:MAG: 4-hydroxythreonine-4-phosphate dehydrogenase PdxA [Myxococcota bacterium]